MYDFKLIVLFMHGFVMQYHANCNSYYFLNKWVGNRRKKRFSPLIFLNYLYAKIFFLCAYTHINIKCLQFFSFYYYIYAYSMIRIFFETLQLLIHFVFAHIFCFSEKPKSFCKIYSTTKEVIHLLINRLQIYDIYA